MGTALRIIMYALWGQLYFSPLSVASCAFSMHARIMCVLDVRASSSPRRQPLCQILFLSHPTAELADGEKSHTQSLSHSFTQPAYLNPREPKLSLQNSYNGKPSGSQQYQTQTFFHIVIYGYCLPDNNWQSQCAVGQCDFRFDLFFSFSFSFASYFFSFSFVPVLSNLLTKTCWWPT